MMMAEARDEDGMIFVYTGGEQEVPQQHVRRARIHRPVKIILSGHIHKSVNKIRILLHSTIVEI